MAERFVTYMTEDAEAGKVPVDAHGVLMPHTGGMSLPMFVEDEMTREQMIQLAKDRTMHLCLSDFNYYEGGYEAVGFAVIYHAYRKEVNMADPCDPCAPGDFKTVHRLRANGIHVESYYSYNTNKVWEIEITEEEYYELCDILGHNDDDDGE